MTYIIIASQYKRSALHFASVGGCPDTMKVLLERRADPNSCDKVIGIHELCNCLSHNYVYLVIHMSMGILCDYKRWCLNCPHFCGFQTDHLNVRNKYTCIHLHTFNAVCVFIATNMYPSVHAYTYLTTLANVTSHYNANRLAYLWEHNPSCLLIDIVFIDIHLLFITG